MPGTTDPPGSLISRAPLAEASGALLVRRPRGPRYAVPRRAKGKIAGETPALRLSRGRETAGEDAALPFVPQGKKTAALDSNLESKGANLLIGAPRENASITRGPFGCAPFLRQGRQGKKAAAALTGFRSAVDVESGGHLKRQICSRSRKSCESETGVEFRRRIAT